MMLKVDLHMHTHFSKDSNMEPGMLVETAVKRGLDAIAITDHNEIEGAKIAKKNADKRIFVITGEEIDTGEGEIIALGISKKIDKYMGLEETCRIAKKMNAFIIAPHPFDSLRKGAGKRLECVIENIDAIEVFNSRTLFNHFNMRAMEFARKYNKPFVASTDSHFYYEIGKAYTVINAEKSEKSIFNGIRNGGKIYGKGNGLRPHIHTAFNKVSRLFIKPF